MPKARALRPKDAATLVLVDRSGGEPRILMGRRHSAQVFLPDKFVFPGGRVDPADRAAASHDELAKTDVDRLLVDMKGATAGVPRARALALAAIRETFEETGLVIGHRLDEASAGLGPARHPSWRRFHEVGFVPRLAGLTFFARAITPPSRPRRYDTRFFLADAGMISARADVCDDELNQIGWFTLDEIRGLDLPNITRAVVEDAAACLASKGAPAAVPFYSFRQGTFRRDLIP